MKNHLLISGILVGLSALGCSSNDTACNDGDATLCTYMTYDIGLPDLNLSGLPPVPPFLGMEIDRAGRPLVNLLLTDPFDLQSQLGGKTQGQVQDAYNAATSQTDANAGWPSYIPIPYIALNLAIWDGIDGNCGNQYEVTATATKYAALATVFSRDYLTLDTTKTSCNSYLALEFGLTTDCGGRKPSLAGTSNVVDVTLNLLQGGLTPTTMPAKAIGTGVTADGDGTPPDTSFPFLLPPS